MAEPAIVFIRTPVSFRAYLDYTGKRIAVAAQAQGARGLDQ